LAAQDLADLLPRYDCSVLNPRFGEILLGAAGHVSPTLSNGLSQAGRGRKHKGPAEAGTLSISDQ